MARDTDAASPSSPKNPLVHSVLDSILTGCVGFLVGLNVMFIVWLEFVVWLLEQELGLVIDLLY